MSHAGTESIDNAAGVAAVMETVRILKATGLKMRRTVRIALWGVEEHPYPDGAYSYVAQHLVDLKGRVQLEHLIRQLREKGLSPRG